jgi:hypothetical protein
MIEMAVAYVGAYFGRKALGLLGRAGTDVDAAVDEKLGQLYEWVKGKVTGRPSAEVSLSLLEDAPDGEKQQTLLVDQLAQAVADDDEAAGELQALVEELERVRPPGISIRGLARGEDVYGEQVGVNVEGALPEGSEIVGEAQAKTVHEGGKNIGVRVQKPPVNPPRVHKGDDER